MIKHELNKPKLKTINIFETFKKFDCEIRTIKEEQDDNEKIYYVVEVGYYESIGEQGLINTFFYDEIPTIDEILKDVEEDLKESLKEYKDKLCLTAREEEYLKILKHTLRGIG